MGLQAPALALRQQDPGSGPIPVGLEICRPRGSHRHSSCLRPQLVAIRSAGGFVARRATSIGTGQAKTPVTRSTRWPHHPQQSSWLGRHQKHHLEDPVVVPRRAARRPQQPVGSRQAVRVTHVSCFTADSGTGRAVDASQAMATRPALLPTAVPPALTAQHRLVPCALKPNSAGGPTQLTGHRVSPCALNPIPEMGPTVIVKHRVPCALEPTSVGPREGVSSEVVGEGEAVGVEGVSLALGKANVLRGCSLSVPRGKLWMLLGPNGCGKSTLLKASPWTAWHHRPQRTLVQFTHHDPIPISSCYTSRVAACGNPYYLQSTSWLPQENFLPASIITSTALNCSFFPLCPSPSPSSPLVDGT